MSLYDKIHPFLVSKTPLTQFAVMFCSASNADVDWYHEVPAFHSLHNKSEPGWEWEDEQGFSALRHSGETHRATTMFPGLLLSSSDCVKPGDSFLNLLRGIL